jgi:phosphate transport system permease protein
VAPLMLVGVKKHATDLPIDGTFPFIHPEREFMHLAYLIYDVGFQSPNSQAAQPMVFTITFLLVTIIALLNVAAIWLRSRLRRRYVAQQF